VIKVARSSSAKPAAKLSAYPNPCTIFISPAIAALARSAGTTVTGSSSTFLISFFASISPCTFHKEYTTSPQFTADMNNRKPCRFACSSVLATRLAPGRSSSKIRSAFASRTYFFTARAPGLAAAPPAESPEPRLHLSGFLAALESHWFPSGVAPCFSRPLVRARCLSVCLSSAPASASPEKAKPLARANSP
jgi:hypothetical protein